MTQNLGSTSNPLSMTGEQWVLEERTDDPLSPEPGECWIRSDLNAGDKIATLKFGDGSEVPIFPTGTSEPGVLEVRRVQTGGQTGYLPVAEPDESRFPQFRLQHNNTVYSLHDDIEPSVIPDSGGDHQWTYDNWSGTLIPDEIANLDADFTGISTGTDAGAGGTHGILNGTDEYAILSGTASSWSHFCNDAVGTVAAWVKPDEWSSDQMTIFGTGLTSMNSIFLGLHPTDGWWWRQDTSNTADNSARSNIDPQIDAWTFSAGVIDGSTVRGYIAEPPGYDVIEYDTDTADTASGDLNMDVNISRDPDDTGRHWSGGFDLSFKDSVAWSQSELQSFVDDSKALYE